MKEYSFLFFMLGSFTGIYYHAVMNAIVSTLCGLDFHFLSVFDKTIVKKDGKIIVSKRPFKLFQCITVFEKKGASVMYMSLVQFAVMAVEFMLALTGMVGICLLPFSNIKLDLIYFMAGIMFFVVQFFIVDSASMLFKNRSIDGYTRYIIKKLQADADINSLDITLSKAETLKKPDKLLNLFYVLCFYKMLYNNEINEMAPLMAKIEKYLTSKTLSPLQKETTLYAMAQYCCLPETAAIEENKDKAAAWFSKWANTAKKPYDSAEYRLAAYYNYFIKADVQQAKKYLDLAQDSRPSYAGTLFETELNDMMIKRLKKILDNL